MPTSSWQQSTSTPRSRGRFGMTSLGHWLEGTKRVREQLGSAEGEKAEKPPCPSRYPLIVIIRYPCKLFSYLFASSVLHTLHICILIIDNLGSYNEKFEQPSLSAGLF